jgi:glutamate racemase
MSFLRSKNVKIIIAACGTVSSVMQNRREYFGIPFVSTILPACKAALEHSKNKKIGVIGTSSTIKSNSHKILIKSLENKALVYQQDCPLFVPLIENGIFNLSHDAVYTIAEQSLNPLVNSGIDTLVLGCTHYPLMKNIIAQIMGPNVRLIDSGKETANYALEVLKKYCLHSKSDGKGKYDFFVSDNAELFSETANKFFGYNVTGKVEKINIELF